MGTLLYVKLITTIYNDNLYHCYTLEYSLVNDMHIWHSCV